MPRVRMLDASDGDDLAELIDRSQVDVFRLSRLSAAPSCVDQKAVAPALLLQEDINSHSDHSRWTPVTTPPRAMLPSVQPGKSNSNTITLRVERMHESGPLKELPSTSEMVSIAVPQSSKRDEPKVSPRLRHFAVSLNGTHLPAAEEVSHGEARLPPYRSDPSSSSTAMEKDAEDEASTGRGTRRASPQSQMGWFDEQHVCADQSAGELDFARLGQCPSDEGRFHHPHRDHHFQQSYQQEPDCFKNQQQHQPMSLRQFLAQSDTTANNEAVIKNDQRGAHAEEERNRQDVRIHQLLAELEDRNVQARTESSFYLSSSATLSKSSHWSCFALPSFRFDWRKSTR